MQDLVGLGGQVAPCARDAREEVVAQPPRQLRERVRLDEREFTDYKTSMITDDDPLRGLLCFWDLGFTHTLELEAQAQVRRLEAGAALDSNLTRVIFL